MNTISMYTLPSCMFPVLHLLTLYIKHRNIILTLIYVYEVLFHLKKYDYLSILLYNCSAVCELAITQRIQLQVTQQRKIGSYIQFPL